MKFLATFIAVTLFLTANQARLSAEDSGISLHTFFPATDAYSGHPKDHIIRELDKWQITYNNHIQEAVVPFFLENIAALSLSTTFRIDSANIEQALYLNLPELFGSTQIYLNDKLLHFFIDSDIPRSILLKAQDVRINEENKLRLEQKIPGRPEDGFPNYVHLFSEPQYLGLLKPVFIIAKARDYIDGFKYKIKDYSNPATIDYSFKFWLNIQNPEPADRYNIDFSISSSQGRLLHRRIKNIAAGENYISDELKISGEQFWSAEKPEYLVLSYALANGNRIMAFDTVRVAVRTADYFKNEFYLNNQKFEIRGINYHRNLLAFENLNYLQKLRHNLLMIKSLGFNAVRCPSYIPDKAFLTLTDSLGLLVFAELPLRRYPIPLFQNDNLLENVKVTLDDAAATIDAHPSFFALGIGQEIMLNDGAVQKFILIAKSYALNKVNCLIYSSPIPGTLLPSNVVTDFYMLDSYHPLQFKKTNQNMFTAPFAVAGNAGIVKTNLIDQWDFDPSEKQRAVFLMNEISALKKSGLQGGFIECYQDWIAAYATHVTASTENPLLMPNGLFSFNGDQKHWLNSIGNIWDISQTNTVGIQPKKKITNYFTILMVFATILFLIIYSKRPRLKENVKRAVKHPYGFFVDMRERRIIPLFNSFLVGAFAALILGNYIGSVFYYYRDSFWMQEIFNLLLEPFGIFEIFLQLSQSPVYITLTFFGILFLYPIIVSIVLYLISLFSKERIRFRQGLAIGLWSGIPLIFLLPLSVFGYHWLYYSENNNIFFLILVFFILWSHFRIINGIRVLFITKTTKVFLILLLSYIVPVLILWAVFRPEPYWYDYFTLLLNARTLF